MFKVILEDAQYGSQDAMLHIIKKFDPIISKYAYMLNDEDSKSDMILFLLELIDKMELDKFLNEGQLMVYILKSLKNEFIKLSQAKCKKAQNELLVDNLFDEQEPVVENDPMENIDSKLLITDLMMYHLTAKEKSILYKFFIEDKPIRYSPKTNTGVSSLCLKHQYVYSLKPAENCRFFCCAAFCAEDCFGGKESIFLDEAKYQW